MPLLIIISLLVGCTLSFPVDYPLGFNGDYDYFSCYSGSCGYELPGDGLFGYRWPVAYRYPSYQRTIDIAKENYVRGYDFLPAEVGTRDKVSIRAPSARLYSSYFPLGPFDDAARLTLNSYNYGYDAPLDLNNPVVGDMLYQWK